MNVGVSRNARPDEKTSMTSIYANGFVCDDAALFLDTHPECMQALRLYQESYAQYDRSRRQAAMSGNIIFRQDGVSDCGWNWTQEPWPWEGGSC